MLEWVTMLSSRVSSRTWDWTHVSYVSCIGGWVLESSVGKESSCNAGDLGSIPGLERSSGEGKGYPLQYSGLENSMECIVHGVAKSQTRLSDFHFHHFVGDFKVHLTCPYMASRNPVVHKCFKVFMGQLGFHFLSVSQGTSQGVGLWGGV